MRGWEAEGANAYQDCITFTENDENERLKAWERTLEKSTSLDY